MANVFSKICTYNIKQHTSQIKTSDHSHTHDFYTHNNCCWLTWIICIWTSFKSIIRSRHWYVIIIIDNLLLTIFVCQGIATAQSKKVSHVPLCRMTMSVYWTGTARLFRIVLHLSAVTMAVVTIVLLITVSYQYM